MDIATMADLSSLKDHGDTVELADGRTVRLTIEPDTDHSIMDDQGEGMWCGALAWDNPQRTNEYGYVMRPIGFESGRCEVIETDGRYRLWWAVPDDIKVGSDQHRKLRETIRDLLRYGYVVVGLTLECEHGGTLDSAYVGGVDSFYPELVDDLASEIDWTKQH
jgi:hypothetical protein